MDSRTRGAEMALRGRVGLALVIVWAATGGCSSATLQTASEFREDNRAGIGRLQAGMSRDEVIAIMGTRTLTSPLGTEAGGPGRTERDTLGVTQVQIPLGSTAPALYNPMRSGIWEADAGTFEVLFYYARLVADDGVVSDDELEPIVLLDGYLVGVGWDYWKQVARDSNLSITTPPEAPRSRP